MEFGAGRAVPKCRKFGGKQAGTKARQMPGTEWQKCDLKAVASPDHFWHVPRDLFEALKGNKAEFGGVQVLAAREFATSGLDFNFQ